MCYQCREKIPPNHSTLQWHPAIAPRPLPQSWSSPPNHSTLQWHPAMAPRPLGQSWSSPSPPNHSTLQWHPAMAPRPLHPAMAPWCHVQSAKVVRRPPPLLEVRTPIAIAIWGKTDPKAFFLQDADWGCSHLISSRRFFFTN